MDKGAKDGRRMTLKEFLASEDEPRLDVGQHFNGGTFMCCHTQFFEQTGVWIEELVPVFQKLDAQLATATQRKVAVLSPDLA